jgi:uncharacterized protein (UPF0332 family)
MIESFIKKQQLRRDSTSVILAKPYLKKSRSNLITMEILANIGNYKDKFFVPKDHSTDEWVVVVAYYAMYMAALSLLAKKGLRSKSHTATAVALQELFVDKRILDRSHIHNFDSIHLRKEEVELLAEVKDRREIAQYSVTKRTTKDIADKTKVQAREFVDTIEEIYEQV